MAKWYSSVGEREKIKYETKLPSGSGVSKQSRTVYNNTASTEAGAQRATSNEEIVCLTEGNTPSRTVERLFGRALNAHAFLCILQTSTIQATNVVTNVYNKEGYMHRH